MFFKEKNTIEETLENAQLNMAWHSKAKTILLLALSFCLIRLALSKLKHSDFKINDILGRILFCGFFLGIFLGGFAFRDFLFGSLWGIFRHFLWEFLGYLGGIFGIFLGYFLLWFFFGRFYFRDFLLGSLSGIFWEIFWGIWLAFFVIYLTRLSCGDFFGGIFYFWNFLLGILWGILLGFCWALFWDCFGGFC